MDFITAGAIAVGLLVAQGGHVQDGYRDTGCDPAQQVQVEGTNYFNNPSCPDLMGNHVPEEVVVEE